MAVLATHVDDVCWAVKLEYERNILRILASFDVRKTEERELRFCDKEIKQLADFSILVTCKETTETINQAMQRSRR